LQRRRNIPALTSIERRYLTAIGKCRGLHRKRQGVVRAAGRQTGGDNADCRGKPTSSFRYHCPVVFTFVEPGFTAKAREGKNSQPYPDTFSIVAPASLNAAKAFPEKSFARLCGK
jgi:hypothetical protein